MTISQLNPSDHTAVATFWKDIFEEMGWGMSELLGTDDIPGYLHFPKGFLLVVKEKDEIVGCAGIKPVHNEDTVGLIKRFYLKANLRGTGIAETLLNELIDEAKKRGFTRLVLDVDFGGTRAIRFYEKHGFERYDQKPVEDWEESSMPEEFCYYQRSIT